VADERESGFCPVSLDELLAVLAIGLVVAAEGTISVVDEVDLVDLADAALALELDVVGVLDACVLAKEVNMLRPYILRIFSIKKL